MDDAESAGSTDGLPGVVPPVQNLPAVFSSDGRFITFTIYEYQFVVTSKYKPPIMPVGKGAYGLVCSAHDYDRGTSVAIKKVSYVFDNETRAKRLLREIKLLSHMYHENIVTIRDVIPPPVRESFDDVYIAYELMDTDLHEIIQSQVLQEEHCKYFLYQLLRGLKYIHSANVIHRDLKPSNLLINSNCDLKICDFGLARVTSDTEFMSEYVVTRWYRAPELLLNSSEYTKPIDIWSVGCIYMEMTCRKPLFPGRDHAHQLRLQMELVGSPNTDDLEFLNESSRHYLHHVPSHVRKLFKQKFPHVLPKAIDLVEKMLIFDPRKRITVEAALEHPYLSSLHDKSDEPVSENQFEHSFDDSDMSMEQMKEAIYQEALFYNPDHRQQAPK
ncbi:hypothetical protein ZOSMA_89G01040 [Zostera marina]|uniref:Mitogen-activated protein kinase n=1 Tax=Zostera marina TaxID=29655 RepID=A0A0K9NK72_ZOSMR|nr:hypothetical protein ZOSMA_89G01040 [Zostera marina]